jgi:hypothetical protein
LKKSKYLILSVLIFALLFGGCGMIKVHEDGSEAADPAKPAEQQTDSGEPALINQLTGEPEETDVSAERPFAVMINNIIVAQPQVGISHADWIYEIEAEGGITRMMALFTHIQDVPNMGSIRSLRPYYLSLALSYDAIMVHGGGSGDAYKDCETYGADHIDGVKDPAAYSAAYYRDPSRGAHGTEHTLFLYGDKIAAYADQAGMRRTHSEGYSNGLSFSQDSAALCPNDAANIKVTLNTSKSTSFTYHPETGKYTGFQYGGDYIDGATNEAVQFSNVLVLQAQMSVYNAKEGRIAAEIIGNGTGWFCTGGKWVAINWSRADVNSPYSYTTQDGTPITFTPGKTYCAIIPLQNAGVDFS